MTLPSRTVTGGPPSSHQKAIMIMNRVLALASPRTSSFKLLAGGENGDSVKT